MDFNKITPKTQIPVLWNWDQTNVVGTATVHENGNVNIDMVPTESTRRFYDMVAKGVLRSFSVGFTADLNKADKEEHFPYLDTLRRQLAGNIGYELHKDSKLSGYDLADKLQARVDEWQPVRDFIKKEAEPTIMSQNEWLEKQAEPKIGADLKRQARAIAIVQAYVKERYAKQENWDIDANQPMPIPDFEVLLVWWSYILGGWKAVLSTTIPDGWYYEVTYNKNRGEIYLDAYQKRENVCIAAEDLD